MICLVLKPILIWFCEMGIFIMSWTCKGFTDGLMTEAISSYSSCSMFSLTNLSGHILNFFGHGLPYLLLELHSSCTFLPWHQTLLQSLPHALTMCLCANSCINRKAFIIKMYNMSKPSLYEEIGGPTKVWCQWKLQERSQNGIHHMDSWPQIYSLQMAPHHMVWFVLCMCLEL